jgi:sulfate adenylyltransferase large subunit
VLIDARNGVGEQTRRHAYIASLLRIPHVVVCVNKMDLVDYDEPVFDRVVERLTDWSARLGMPDVTFIPISALHGDNVVERSEQMGWYQGPPLLYHLEHVVIASDRDLSGLRLPVQWVIRPNDDQHHDYRGYAGQLAGGVLRPGDQVVVLPSGQRTRIEAIDTFEGQRECAFPPMSVTLRTTDQLDISRGEMIVSPDDPPAASREIEATVCWMSDTPMRPGGRYQIKHTTRTAKAVIDTLDHRMNVNTLQHEPAEELALNEIGRIHLRTSQPLVTDPYTHNRTTGSFILIDETTGDTVGAGMICGGAGPRPRLT